MGPSPLSAVFRIKNKSSGDNQLQGELPVRSTLFMLTEAIHSWLLRCETLKLFPECNKKRLMVKILYEHIDVRVRVMATAVNVFGLDKILVFPLPLLCLLNPYCGPGFLGELESPPAETEPTGTRQIQQSPAVRR